MSSLTSPSVRLNLGMRRMSAGRSVFGILQELDQPRALHGTAFPGEIGSHVAAVAIDAMATEASQIGHQFSGFAGGLIVRFRLRGTVSDGGSVWERSLNASSAVVSESICAGVNVYCGIFKPWPESARLFDLGRDVIWQRVLHAGQENELRDRLAADAAELGREVFRLLDAVDFVAGCAAVFGDQVFAVSDLRWSCGFKMNVGEKIGVGFARRNPERVATCSIAQAIVRHRGR